MRPLGTPLEQRRVCPGDAKAASGPRPPLFVYFGVLNARHVSLLSFKLGFCIGETRFPRMRGSIT